MIADDMMTFIKKDIIVFGIGVFAFIIITLWFVFRKVLWITIPISSCFFAVIIMIGFLGSNELESYSYIIKFYSYDVDTYNGYEHSHKHKIYSAS